MVSTSYGCVVIAKEIKMRDLGELPKGYEYKNVLSNNNNCIVTKFKSKEDVEKWITDLQNMTKETWTIEKTFKVPPNSPRNIFKRIYRCHFNTSLKRTGSTNKPKKKSRHINCQAKINVIIKKIFDNSKSKKEPSVTEDWPCIIKFQKSHNHRTDVVEALRERPMSDEAKNHITELFNRGHSAASAYHTFCAEKMEEYGDEYENILYDRFYMPTKNDVANLWKKKFKDDFGDRTGSTMLEKLEETLAQHKERSNVLYKISRCGDEYAVAICTPLMQRVLELKQASEVMFVDASGNCDVYDHKVYFFVTQTAVGGLPIGCILSSCQNSDLFDVAVASLIEITPKKIQPTVILTGNNLGERNVLQKNWPNATLLLCTFHVLKAVWRWIITSKNGVPRDDAQNCYKLFKSILYARTLIELERAKTDFFINCQHGGLKKYIQEVYLNQEQTWCNFYRLNLPIRGSDTKNYTEVMFRLLKDIHIPLERSKAFNLVQLTNYIIVCFENYYKQRILDLLFQRTSKAVATKYLPSSSDSNMMVSCIDIERREFSVHSTDSGNTYLVDMHACKCSCAVGYNGKHCNHQASVLKQYHFPTAFNTLCNKIKLELYKVATGKSADNNIFKSLLITTEEREEETEQKDIEKMPPLEMVKVETPEEMSVETMHDVNDIKKRYLEHCNTIIKYLEDDPQNFAPALDTYLGNIKKYVVSKTTLLSGLCTAFKWKGIIPTKSNSKNICRRRGKCIPVQPTSAARRSGTKKTAVGKTTGIKN